MNPIANGPRSFNPTMDEFVNNFPSMSRLSEFWRGTNSNSPGRSNDARDFTTEQVKLAQKPGRVIANAWILTLGVSLTTIGSPHFEIHVREGNTVGAGQFDDATFGDRSRYDSKDTPIWSGEQVPEFAGQSHEAKKLAMQRLMGRQRQAQLEALGLDAQELKVRMLDTRNRIEELAARQPEKLDELYARGLEITASRKQIFGSQKLVFVALSASMASSWEIQRNNSKHRFELFKDIQSGSEAPLVSVVAIEESNKTKGVFKRIGFGFINFQKWCDEIHRERCSVVL
ncbi:hypothetical protein BKA80DRAFT_263404, partial [Phyllosticta citrichinensis]